MRSGGLLSTQYIAFLQGFAKRGTSGTACYYVVMYLVMCSNLPRKDLLRGSTARAQSLFSDKGCVNPDRRVRRIVREEKGFSFRS